MSYMKVGEVAERTGLTVRTLHHYDEIGLLRPEHRSEAGYRLYSVGDLARLLRIQSLRRLGLSLDHVRASLEDPRFSLRAVIDLQIDRLTEKIAQNRELLERLKTIAARLDEEEDVPVRELVEMVEMMERYEKYYSKEQLDELTRRAEEIGRERIERVQTIEWPTLIGEVRRAIDEGVSPDSERARDLAERWMSLVHEFSGGSREIESSAKKMWQNEESLSRATGIDADMMQFVHAAQSTRR